MLVSELDLHQRHVHLLRLLGRALRVRQADVGQAGLPAGLRPARLLYGGRLGPRVLLLYPPAEGRACCQGNGGRGCWGGFPPASAFSPLLPLSMPVAQPLVSDHGTPALLVTGRRTETPQRDLFPGSHFFYINGDRAVVGGELSDGRVVASSTSLHANLATVSDGVLHPGSDAIIHLLLCSLALVPDVELDVSEQSRVQGTSHPLRQVSASPATPAALVVGSRRRPVFHPERLVRLVVVVVVAADAGVHAVVTQEVRRSGGALAQSQSAAVLLEHAVVQQLVQDGLAEGGAFNAADGINAVVVIPVQETQLHLVLEVLVCDVDGWFAGFLEDQKISLVHDSQRVDLHLANPVLRILKLEQVILKVTFNKRFIALSVLLQELHTLGPNFSMKALAMQHLLGDSPEQARAVFGDLLPMQTDGSEVVIH